MHGFERPVHHVGNAQRSQFQAHRPREIQEARNERIQPVHFRRNVSGQLAGERKRACHFLRKHLGGAFDDAQRVANLVRQAGGKLPQRRQSFRPPRFLFGAAQLAVGFLERLRKRLVSLHLPLVLHGELIHQNRRQKEEKHANRKDRGAGRREFELPKRGNEKRRIGQRGETVHSSVAMDRNKSPPLRSADSKWGNSCC